MVLKGRECEALGRVVEWLASEACREFPLVYYKITIIPRIVLKCYENKFKGKIY